MKSNLFEELQKLEGEEKIAKLKEYEEIFGVRDVSPFGTYTEEIFEERLAEMNLADMRALAKKVGVNPMKEKPQVKELLRKAFRDQVKNVKGNVVPWPDPTPMLDKNNPNHKEAIAIIENV